jgi:hypothetical protein
MQASFMKTLFSFLILVFFCSVPAALAQEEASAKENDDTGFAEVSEKFVRNMKLLSTLMLEPESQKMMQAVIGQSDDLVRIYRSGNADSKRESKLRRKEIMTERDGLSDSDQRKLQKAEDDLRRLDPDGQFNKAKTQVQKTVSELQRNLGQIYTQDSDQKDLIRIIRQHLTFYNSALSKLN